MFTIKSVTFMLPTDNMEIINIAKKFTISTTTCLQTPLQSSLRWWT